MSKHVFRNVATARELKEWIGSGGLLVHSIHIYMFYTTTSAPIAACSMPNNLDIQSRSSSRPVVFGNAFV